MKNTYQLLSSFLFISIIMLAVQNKSNAQCSLVSKDASGHTTITEIPACDFPLYTVTGDPLANQTIINEWMSEIQALYPEWKNATTSYFTVHQSDLAAMTANRQAELLANPFVKIVP